MNTPCLHVYIYCVSSPGLSITSSSLPIPLYGLPEQGAPRHSCPRTQRPWQNCCGGWQAGTQGLRGGTTERVVVSSALSARLDPAVVEAVSDTYSRRIKYGETLISSLSPCAEHTTTVTDDNNKIHRIEIMLFSFISYRGINETETFHALWAS